MSRKAPRATSNTLFDVLVRFILDEDGDPGVVFHLLHAYEAQLEAEAAKIGEGTVLFQLNFADAERAMLAAYKHAYLEVVPDRDPNAIAEEFVWPETLTQISASQDYPTSLIEYIGLALGRADGHGYIALRKYSQRKKD